MTVQQDSRWEPVKKFAERYGFSPNFVYGLVQKKKIRSIKVGGRVLVAANVLDLLADGETAATE